MIKEDSLDDVVKHRNKLLLNLFTANGIEVRLVGDVQKPSVVYNEEVLLSCYVKNFDLYFVKEPFSDEIVKSFKLKSEFGISKLELHEAIELCSHRPVYKIKLSGSDDLFLVGYNYLSENDQAGRYPVFGKYKPKVYFDMGYAVNLVETLTKDNYKVVIV